MNLTAAQLTEIERICRAHHVVELHLIGSVLRADFRADSDVDFLIRFDAPDEVDYLKNYFDLIEKLENYLNRKVDLVPNKPFRNPAFAKQIRTTKQLVYEKAEVAKMAA